MDLKVETEEMDASQPPPVEVFAHSSTLHGISHIFTYERFCVKRCLWVVCFLGSLTFLLFLCVDRIHFYFEYPHVTKLDEVTTPIMTFPAVTFCNLNAFRFSRVTRNDLYHAGELLALLNQRYDHSKHRCTNFRYIYCTSTAVPLRGDESESSIKVTLYPKLCT